MVTVFIQGVRDEEIIRRLHGRYEIPQTMDALMAATKMYVNAEKSVALARSLERKKDAWRPNEMRPPLSIMTRTHHTPRQFHGSRYSPFNSFWCEHQRPHHSHRKETSSVSMKITRRYPTYLPRTKSRSVILTLEKSNGKRLHRSMKAPCEICLNSMITIRPMGMRLIDVGI
jgi:hypothetical protein